MKRTSNPGERSRPNYPLRRGVAAGLLGTIGLVSAAALGAFSGSGASESGGVKKVAVAPNEAAVATWAKQNADGTSKYGEYKVVISKGGSVNGVLEALATSEHLDPYTEPVSGVIQEETEDITGKLLAENQFINGTQTLGQVVPGSHFIVEAQNTVDEKALREAALGQAIISRVDINQS